MDFKENNEAIRNYLAECTHVVIKLGTNILTPHIESSDMSYFKGLALQIKKLVENGKKVLVVSSGAVGFGKKIKDIKTGELKKKETIAEKQAFASMGQGLLIDTYRENFQTANLETGQILVSLSDFLSRNHYKNLKRTLDQLMEWGAIPVINENDAITVEGLKFGDNDTLSAFIAGMYPQSLLIILTTVDGFYLDDKKVDLVTRLDETHFAAAGGATAGGIGGMKTKLHAAKKILLSGQAMNIASGEHPAVIEEIIQAQNVGTWFYPLISSSLSFRKRWLVHHRHVMGKITIDSGAREALKDGSASLLLVGVLSVEGNFSAGSVIEIVEANKNELARGIAAYSSDEIHEMLEVNEKRRGVYVVHRDNMIMTNE
ncbi:MAG: glutamate 5-kinase [Leptospirales bacterium]